MNWLLKWWRATQRSTDLTTLWPVCKQHARDIDHARAAFFMHAVNDTAWTRDYSEDEIIARVSELQ